ncbi:ROK family transcriptional regulator [Amylibacter sp. IMCC11727]|uniref:ROK family transcriptional regulator n=1 Tax=Amylibacter sp. IMCC11727 TaxID=3039851 RepID=UPI00244DE460|nr:ROK family transcriptional regulator [Amylibacter sp. IMCC11727]WGI22302.1 ROK family transcriptional regulator [Amylibacter sp. IMCC11727]
MARDLSGLGRGDAWRGSNQGGMRAYNERLVLSLIRENGALAKAEIARSTGLSAQTVSVIMRALEADGLLVRGAPVRGKVGQPSVPMALAKDGAFFFGLKVGRRSLEMVLTDFLGNVLHRVRARHPYPKPETTVQFASDAIAQMTQKLPPEHRSRIAGLGIALPFQLWDWAAAEAESATSMQRWKGYDIAKAIGAVCAFPVYVCNDASSACGAELVFGNLNTPRDFLYVFVGYFVGGGLVLDNGVYTGRTGNGAALGSLMVSTRGGDMRQLVEVASLSVLEQALEARGDQGLMVWDDVAHWDVPKVPMDAWLDDAAHGIAQAIMASVCLVDVGHVFVEGWMPETMRSDLVQRLRAEIAKISAAGVQKPVVAEGSIGPDARALGAASLPLSKRFLVERNSYQKGPVQ